MTPRLRDGRPLKSDADPVYLPKSERLERHAERMRNRNTREQRISQRVREVWASRTPEERRSITAAAREARWTR